MSLRLRVNLIMSLILWHPLQPRALPILVRIAIYYLFLRILKGILFFSTFYSIF